MWSGRLGMNTELFTMAHLCLLPEQHDTLLLSETPMPELRRSFGFARFFEALIVSAHR